MSLEKVTLRSQLLQQRQSLKPEIWQQKSQQICNILLASSWLQKSKTVLAYFSTRFEPDLSSLFNLHYQWGFPRCVGKSLEWHLWKPGEILETGRYGILEPSPNAPILTSSMIDLILVPGIACDYQGYRLGYGGGFYDRLLAIPAWSSIPTIGIIFDFALLPHLPSQEWDQPLTAVCTNNSLIVLKNSRLRIKISPQRDQTNGDIMER